LPIRANVEGGRDQTDPTTRSPGELVPGRCSDCRSPQERRARQEGQCSSRLWLPADTILRSDWTASPVVFRPRRDALCQATATGSESANLSRRMMPRMGNPVGRPTRRGKFRGFGGGTHSTAFVWPPRYLWSS
jgi:hypothetical protein